jgi:pimeloyl-ACP methyl ester carboxylesterase
MTRRAWFTIAACAAAASSASAQATPVLLVHGIFSDASTWNTALPVLNGTGSYSASAINLTWQNHLDSQASDVSSYLTNSGVGPSTILVAHSQGGLVSRIATRSTPVAGILTIGTPHAGAPIVASGPGLQADFLEIDVDEALVVLNMPDFCDIHPDDEVCQVPGEAVDYAVVGLGLAELAGDIWAEWTLSYDDLHDMNPASATIAGLQSGFGSEQTGGRRVSIQVDDEEEWTGPFRFLYGADLGSTVSQEAENKASDMATIGLVLELWGIHLEATIDSEDADYFDEEEMAAAMQDMGFFLYDFCPIDWNYNIVGSGSNDGIVPWTSQAMPGSNTVQLLFVAHNEETSQATTILGVLDHMTNR